MKYPEVDQIVFESVVNLLVKKEFLISNLRVNSSCINPFKHLLERISQDYANIKSELFSQLFLLDQKITEYNSEQLNDKSCLKLDEIKQLMKQIQDIKNGLQIDLCCRNQIFITNGIKINVEEFADFIENCTYQSNAAKFIDAFIEKYGYQRVKFLDVIKDNRLNNLMTDRSDSIKFNDKLQLIILSIFEEERSDSVDLYKYKDRFIFDHDNNLKLSDSMELAFYVTKENNKYELITTPLGGSHKRNNIIGRFKYLYDMHEDQGNTYAISYTPNNSHVYGVIQSILPCEKHIYCGGYDETGLDYNDIYIGIKNMEICFYSKSQLKEIKIINNNMATLDTMPHPLKRLLELASDGIASPISFLECIYHMVYNYPGIHFPEIKYKQIIVVPESWRLDNNVNLKFTKSDDFR